MIKKYSGEPDRIFGKGVVMMNPYIGHETQCYGIEEHRLVGGKGDGMRLLQVNNGDGLEATISLDRNAELPQGILKFLKPGERKTYSVTVKINEK